MIKYLVLSFQLLVATGLAQSNPNKDYSDKTPTINANNIFRSEDNHYRIKIPQKWTIHKGNALGAEFNSKSECGTASLSIVVATLKDPPKFTAHDIPVDVVMKTIQSQTPTARLLDSEKQYLSNEKASYIKYKFNYKTLDIDVDIVCIQYVVIKGTRMFTITLQAQAAAYPTYLDIFKETLGSFTFEI